MAEVPEISVNAVYRKPNPLEGLDQLEPPVEYVAPSPRTRSGRAALVSGDYSRSPERIQSQDNWRRQVDAEKLRVAQDARNVSRGHLELELSKHQAALAKQNFDQQKEIIQYKQTAQLLNDFAGLDYKDPDYPTKELELVKKYPIATTNPAVQKALEDRRGLFSTHYKNQRDDSLRDISKREAMTAAEAAQGLNLKPTGITSKVGDTTVRYGEPEDQTDRVSARQDKAALRDAKARLAGITAQESYLSEIIAKAGTAADPDDKAALAKVLAEKARYQAELNELTRAGHTPDPDGARGSLPVGRPSGPKKLLSDPPASEVPDFSDRTSFEAAFKALDSGQVIRWKGKAWKKP